MATVRRNPDRVVRARIRQPLHFPDMSERFTLRLVGVERYVARAHFEPWHKVLGRPDFQNMTGVFSPLTYVEIAVDDVPCHLDGRLEVVGEGFLGKTLRPDGTLRHLVRDGHHEVRRLDGARVASSRMVNTFTRYHPDPAQRRVEDVLAILGFPAAPSRVVAVPALHDLVPDRAPDVEDPVTHVWHLGHTDVNRHVNGMEYVRTLEHFLADVLHADGADLRRLWAVRARIVFRKPCFRGEAHRRVAWRTGDPRVLVGAVRKAADPPDAPPAAAVEITWGEHPPTAH